jgi:hypothetical protein
MTSSAKVHIVGGGLAGSEAAWQLARSGVPVVLHEMRPIRQTEAHLTSSLAELVCSNSFRSDDAQNNAVGLLHEEMRRADSLILHAADTQKRPAGGALAVDRHGFSSAVETALLAHPLVTLERAEVTDIPSDWEHAIIATGPLTAPALARTLTHLTGQNALAFFDAIAPIVHHESIDLSIAWKQSRYDKSGPGGSGADYINCPLDRAQYDAFVAGLDFRGLSFWKGEDNWLDVASGAAGKHQGLAIVADRLGVAQEDVLALGDWYTDVELVAWAGRGVALPGAPPEVVAVADDVTDTFAAGGTVMELEKWFGSSHPPRFS